MSAWIRMAGHFPIVALGLAACASASYADAPSGVAAGTSDFHFQKALAANAKVDVHNRNGSITVEPATGNTIEVSATKSGRDAARVQVIAREENGTIVVCAIWPGEDAASCREDEHGHGDHDVRARVDFHLRVPAQVTTFAATANNGAVRAKGIKGDAHATSMNGVVEIEADGAIVARTMNGAVHVRAAAGKPVDLDTSNGEITLALPASASVDVDASTTNGRITSDFGAVPPPTLPALHAAHFRVNAGGTDVHMHTTNGDVHLQRL